MRVFERLSAREYAYRFNRKTQQLREELNMPYPPIAVIVALNPWQAFKELMRSIFLRRSNMLKSQ